MPVVGDGVAQLRERLNHPHVELDQVRVGDGVVPEGRYPRLVTDGCDERAISLPFMARQQLVRRGDVRHRVRVGRAGDGDGAPLVEHGDPGHQRLHDRHHDRDRHIGRRAEIDHQVAFAIAVRHGAQQVLDVGLEIVPVEVGKGQAQADAAPVLPGNGGHGRQECGVVCETDDRDGRAAFGAGSLEQNLDAVASPSASGRRGQVLQVNKAGPGLPLGFQALAEVAQVVVCALLVPLRLEVEPDRGDFEEGGDAVLDRPRQAAERLVLSHFPFQNWHVMAMIEHKGLQN